MHKMPHRPKSMHEVARNSRNKPTSNKATTNPQEPQKKTHNKPKATYPQQPTTISTNLSRSLMTLHYQSFETFRRQTDRKTEQTEGQTHRHKAYTQETDTHLGSMTKPSKRLTKQPTNRSTI